MNELLPRRRKGRLPIHLNDGQRAIAMGKFIEAFAKGLTVKGAAKEAGVSRQTILEWRKRYPDFDEAYNGAYEAGTDTYEDRLYTLAHSDNEKVAATATIVALKMRKRFVERTERHVEQEHTHSLDLAELFQELKALKETAGTGSALAEIEVRALPDR